MDTSSPVDPFSFWRDLYNKAEQAWTEAVQKTISTPAYAESMGKSSQAMLNNFEVWRNFSERYLNEVWNLPTRTDLGRLGEVIVGIDAKADDLDDRADQIDAVLTRLEERLAELDRRVAGLAESGPVAVQQANRQLAERLSGLEGRLDDLIGRTDQVLAALADPAAANGNAESSPRPRRGNRAPNTE